MTTLLKVDSPLERKGILHLLGLDDWTPDALHALELWTIPPRLAYMATRLTVHQDGHRELRVVSVRGFGRLPWRNAVDCLRQLAQVESCSVVRCRPDSDRLSAFYRRMGFVLDKDGPDLVLT